MPAEEIKGVTRDQKKQASLGESEIFGRIINEQLITKIVFNSHEKVNKICFSMIFKDIKKGKAIH